MFTFFRCLDSELALQLGSKYSWDPKTGQVRFSNGQPCFGFWIVRYRMVFTSLDRFIYKIIFAFRKLNLKKSCFRMNPVLEWSVFGSLLYRMCPVFKRSKLVLLVWFSNAIWKPDSPIIWKWPNSGRFEWLVSKPNLEKCFQYLNVWDLDPHCFKSIISNLEYLCTYKLLMGFA